MNSIGVMSQKFLMLILSSENGIISIDFAAEVLLGGMNNDKTESGNLKSIKEFILHKLKINFYF